jgi:hypothetical protein
MPSEKIFSLFNCGLILRITKTKCTYTQTHEQGEKVTHITDRNGLTPSDSDTTFTNKL